MPSIERIHSVVLCGSLLAAVSWLPVGPLHAADKVPVPSADARNAAAALVKDVYGEEYATAANSEQKAALAQKLLQAAKGMQQGTANQYELLRVAWDLATQAGDAQLAMQITDEIVRVYAVDAPNARLATIKTTDKFARSSAQRAALATATLQLADEAADADDYDRATELASLGLAAARKARDGELVKQIVAREKQIKEAAEIHAKAQVALETLENDPANPAANQAAGEYYCFVKKDWTKGVPMLALGTEAAFKSLAIRELKLSAALRGQNISAFPSEQAELGDTWWDLGEKHDEDMKRKLRSRAAYWYRQASPNLRGLVKQKCDKRLEQVPETDAPNEMKIASPSTDRKLPSKAPVETTQPTVAVAPRIDSTPVCAKLEAKKPPEGLAAGTIPFSAPRGEGRSGANGFLMEAAAGWDRRGTVWACTYRRTESADGVHFIHPLGAGHVMVTVTRNGLHVASPGPWPSRAYRPLQQTSLPLVTANNFAQMLDIEGDAPRTLLSILAPDGRFQFFLDGQPLAGGVVPFAVPLQLTPDFQGENLPMTLRPGMGGVIIGPRDGGLNRATDITFGLFASGGR